jgi:hypothetical protein
LMRRKTAPGGLESRRKLEGGPRRTSRVYSLRG